MDKEKKPQILIVKNKQQNIIYIFLLIFSSLKKQLQRLKSIENLEIIKTEDNILTQINILKKDYSIIYCMESGR